MNLDTMVRVIRGMHRRGSTLRQIAEVMEMDITMVTDIALHAVYGQVTDLDPTAPGPEHWGKAVVEAAE